MSRDHLVLTEIPYLEHVNTLPGNMAQQFILLIEMSAKHLCRLVHRVLNLHRDTSTRLGFLDNLLDRSEKPRSPHLTTETITYLL